MLAIISNQSRGKPKIVLGVKQDCFYQLLLISCTRMLLYSSSIKYQVQPFAVNQFLIHAKAVPTCVPGEVDFDSKRWHLSYQTCYWKKPRGFKDWFISWTSGGFLWHLTATLFFSVWSYPRAFSMNQLLASVLCVSNTVDSPFTSAGTCQFSF